MQIVQLLSKMNLIIWKICVSNTPFDRDSQNRYCVIRFVSNEARVLINDQ